MSAVELRVASSPPVDDRPLSPEQTAAERRRRLLGPLLLIPVFVGLALALPLHEAYISNQNQYLLPVVGPTIGALQEDWLFSTVDPYPLFTAVSSALFAAGGKPAFLVGAIAAAAVAWWALYLLARDLLGGRNRSAAVLATVLVAAAQYLPFMPNVFGGVAGQYILEQPMYYQPAAAGSLVLVGAALALRARIRPEAVRPATRYAALAAAALGCALHPTYLLVAALLLFSAMLVDLATERRSVRLVAGYAGTVAVLAVAGIAANPAIVDLAAGDSSVVSRFAFERIGHHTLISQWGIWDLRYVALILLAAGLWWRTSSWFARWLVLSVTLALGLALVVEVTRNASLALAFPARATVILVPLAMVAGAAWCIRWLLATEYGPKLQRSAGWVAVPLVVVLAVAGVVQTVERHTAGPDEVTALVARAEPAGVGLVPLDYADNVRLNAGAALFVDHKSPPYASDDLAEWFRRLDAVRTAQSDAQRYCDLLVAERIDWIVLQGAPTPSCVADWTEVAGSGRFRLLAAPS
jgi:hypothetical protein